MELTRRDTALLAEVAITEEEESCRRCEEPTAAGLWADVDGDDEFIRACPRCIGKFVEHMLAEIEGRA